MKKTMKRIFTLGLCVLMFVTTLAFPASAKSVTSSIPIGIRQADFSLYLDQMILSAYTEYNARAELLEVNVELWQRNASTGAITQCLDRYSGRYDISVVSVSSTADYGYVFHSAKSTHRVKTGGYDITRNLGPVSST